jgi:hypothetical protein
MYALHSWDGCNNSSSQDMSTDNSRLNEWFVPKFGPLKFRALIGLLFLPYTAMCVCFTILGGLLSPVIHGDRLFAIALIYFLALGLSAHAADSIGSKKVKPWANYLSKRELTVLLISGIIPAYLIGLYYIINYVPLLSFIAIIEGFFLFAYNFELFGGLFHGNFWFSVSWGALPLLAGFVMQTNSITILSILISFLTGLVSYIEIRLSREYKVLKRTNTDIAEQRMLELRLKAISLGTVAITITFFSIDYFRYGLEILSMGVF